MIFILTIFLEFFLINFYVFISPSYNFLLKSFGNNNFNFTSNVFIMSRFMSFEKNLLQNKEYHHLHTRLD